MAAEPKYYTVRLAEEALREPVIARIAELVHKRGIDSSTAVIADLFEDDEYFLFGLLVTPERRVIQFGYSWLNVADCEGTFSEWNDLTSSWQGCIYVGAITEGLKLAATAT